MGKHRLIISLDERRYRQLVDVAFCCGVCPADAVEHIICNLLHELEVREEFNIHAE